MSNQLRLRRQHKRPFVASPSERKRTRTCEYDLMTFCNAIINKFNNLFLLLLNVINYKYFINTNILCAATLVRALTLKGSDSETARACKSMRE